MRRYQTANRYVQRAPELSGRPAAHRAAVRRML